jgi:hypothetical protein
VSALPRFVTSPEFTDAFRRQQDAYDSPLDIARSSARASIRECERWGHPQRAEEWRHFLAQLETLE